MALNDKAIKAFKPSPTRAEHFDDLVKGLALRVNAGGTKTWVLFYRFPAGRHGRLRRLTLEEYPTLGLKAARKLARRKLNRLAETGLDPAAEKQADQAPGDKFKDLADAYMKVAKTTKKSWREDQRILDSELLPAWKSIKVRDISRRDVRTMVDAIAERPAPIMANRVWALASRIFNFAISKDWIDANPAARIEQRPEGTRDRVLTDQEIRELWTALDGCLRPPRVDDPKAKAPAVPAMIARGMQVLLVTAQRPGEVFGMRRADLDLTEGAAWWTIPPEHAKNGEPHRVPLAVTAVRW